MEGVLKKAAKQFPVIFLTGPRQSGKTTLVKSVFKKHKYVSLEDTDERRFALEDPRGFLARFTGSVILDEVQRAPDILSHIQTIVDEDKKPGRFILTGSQQFLLLQGISQSLAGRVALLELLPLSLAEIEGRKSKDPLSIFNESYRLPDIPKIPLEELLFTGSYPSLHAKNTDRNLWMKSYERTYVERDVRNILKIGDTATFSRFLRLCAGRAGQLLNLSSLGNDCGVTHSTARRWLSILEASHIVILLKPHHKKFARRLVKSPKLYFLDAGLLCYLLLVRHPEELKSHALRGGIMESFVISELWKSFVHNGEEPPLFFWRDHTGHEIDLLMESSSRLYPVEIKSSRTVSSEFFRHIRFFCDLAGRKNIGKSAVIHAGDDSYIRNGTAVRPWWVV